MIAIMSDSHDSLDSIKRAVKIFNEEKVTAVLHAGDIVSPFTAKAFQELDAKLYFVFGNNDGDKLTLKSWFEDFGAHLCGDFGSLEIDGIKIGLLHGINETMVQSLAVSGNFDVIVRGHTHRSSIENMNGTLVINPGEAAGVLTGRSTVAFLDPGEMDVRIVDI